MLSGVWEDSSIANCSLYLVAAPTTRWLLLGSVTNYSLYCLDRPPPIALSLNLDVKIATSPRLILLAWYVGLCQPTAMPLNMHSQALHYRHSVACSQPDMKYCDSTFEQTCNHTYFTRRQCDSLADRVALHVKVREKTSPTQRMASVQTTTTSYGRPPKRSEASRCVQELSCPQFLSFPTRGACVASSTNQSVSMRGLCWGNSQSRLSL